MKNFIFCFCFIVSSSTIFSQNLVPNGSFESTTNLDYLDPFSAFAYLDSWYPANYIPVDPLYPGTPDLFDVNNIWPPSNTPNFWNVVDGAADGDFHVGIANHLKFEGYTEPEAVATSLIEPLQANEYYYIELGVRNKGVDGYLDHAPILCVPEQYKQIQVLLDTDSIFVTIDEQNKESYSEVSKVIPLRSERMEVPLAGSWDKIGTCFQADGDEQFFAITTTMGRFNVNPPCSIYDDHWDVFYIYYFDIDDVKLIKLPDELTISQTICAGRSTKFNIDDLAELPVMQREIEYHWSDGLIDSVNYISEAGTYHIDAVIDCKTIPIRLEVNDLKCDPDVFIPNAFSPNGDGYNDQLETFISLDLPVKAYRFSVYNRWGAQLFSTINSDIKWDGTFHGKIMDNGVYIWLLEYTVDDIELGIQHYKESGDVTIFK